MTNPEIKVWPGKPWALLPLPLLKGVPVNVFKRQFPNARHAPKLPQFNGTPMLLVPHDIRTHGILKNLGGKIPAPIFNTYDWVGTTPFLSQKVTAAFLTLNPRAYVLSQMGTGKTRAALYAIDWLIKQGEIDQAIIAAPLSTLTCVWEREIEFQFPDLRSIILHGSRSKREKYLAKTNWNVAVINHDGLKVMLDLLERGKAGTQLFLIDELAVFRTQRTNLWRAGRRVADGHKFVWGMTGSPTPNSPTDAWAQVRLVDPPRCTMPFTAFRERVQQKVSMFKWEPRPDAHDKVHALMQPAIRFTRKDVKELPPLTEVDRTVAMSPLQVKLYKQMKEKLLLMHAAGSVTAVNAGVLLFKLAQIAAGVVYDDNGDAIVIGAPDRLKVTLDLINEASGKVIVFTGFRHTLSLVYDYLKAHRDVEQVHGGVPSAARNRIFMDFQNTPNPQIIVAHPKTMAHGLTLTAADTIIWYSPYPGRETYEQACARITRIGQTYPALIVRLIGSGVERQMYNLLTRRGNFQQLCLDLFTNKLDSL